MASELLELAGRCEAASADETASLLIEAFDLTNWRTKRNGSLVTHNPEWFAFDKLIRAGAFLDAALTLRPEDWRIGFEENASCDEPGKSYAWCWPFESTYDPDWQMGQEGQQSNPDGQKGYAATPALALTAAALRARALTKDQSNEA